MPINHEPLRQENNTNISKKIEKRNTFLLTEPQYTFDDIILSDNILEEIKSIIAISTYKELIYETWGLKKVLKKNKNISFNLYGESGTGKTMTAHAISHMLNKKLLIVNYAEIESKYVGETSKNLVTLFSTAEMNDAVILFDEADALLSRRVTAMSSATDVSVNQTRNVLLKILDEYQGIVIFTTNFIQNYDLAFFRRIMSHIKFPLPDVEMRKRIWAHYLVESLPLQGQRIEIIDRLSELGGITGSDVSQAVLKAAVHCVLVGNNAIREDILHKEIAKIISMKETVRGNSLEISSRKVSKEYVKEKIEKEGTMLWEY